MLAKDHQRVTGLSGNEIFCLSKIGMTAGQLCIGNSVVAVGVGRGLGAGLSTLAGGEVTEVTSLVHDGRVKSFNRMMAEAKHYGGVGLSGVAFDIINHGGNLEFLTTGSTVHGATRDPALPIGFSTSADVQELYCQMDAGFEPKHFVFSNVAYSIGVGGGLGGAFRAMKRGEVPQYTEIFDRTRHLALNRIADEAKRYGANSVIGLRTTIAPVLGCQEMLMIGTASHHPALEAYAQNPVTSDMTNEEMWNMVNLGYLPLKMLMGVSVYSLGFTGGVAAALKTLAGGEVAGLTDILYEAREKALERLERDAKACGADEVVGVKVNVYDLGSGLIEFMAIGTAVKKFPGVSTKNNVLPAQAIIRDRETFVDSTARISRLGESRASSASAVQKGPLGIIMTVMFVLFYVFLMFLKHR